MATVYEPELYTRLWERVMTNGVVVDAINSLWAVLNSLNSVELGTDMPLWNPYSRPVSVFYTQYQGLPYEDITNAMCSLIKEALYCAGVSTKKDAGAMSLSIYYRMIETGENFTLQSQKYLSELDANIISTISDQKG